MYFQYEKEKVGMDINILNLDLVLTYLVTYLLTYLLTCLLDYLLACLLTD